MRAVHCSWVDMMAIRQALAAGNGRGSQKAMERMRCVDKATVSTWKATCDVVEALEGKVDLSQVSSFQPTHAREIARVYRRKAKKWTDKTKREILEWVERCEGDELTVEQLREELVNTDKKLSAPCRIKDLDKLVASGKTYGTIYADPPWAYSNQATRSSTSKNYPTLTVEQICALPVSKLAAENCHLHLWTTNAFLFDAGQVLKSWGFEYKSVFVWVKPQLGIGNYWRVSHEFLLLGIKGQKSFRNHGQRSWIESDRTEHSAKPATIRKIVEAVSPRPRFEMFGRDLVDGWDVWGNQIRKGMFDGDVTDA